MLNIDHLLIIVAEENLTCSLTVVTVQPEPSTLTFKSLLFVQKLFKCNIFKLKRSI